MKHLKNKERYKWPKPNHLFLQNWIREYVTIVREFQGNLFISSFFCCNLRYLYLNLHKYNELFFRKKEENINSIWLFRSATSLKMQFHSNDIRLVLWPACLHVLPLHKTDSNHVRSYNFYLWFIWGWLLCLKQSSYRGFHRTIRIVYLLALCVEAIKNSLSFCYDWMTFIWSKIIIVVKYVPFSSTGKTVDSILKMRRQLPLYAWHCRLSTSAYLVL